MKKKGYVIAAIAVVAIGGYAIYAKFKTSDAQVRYITEAVQKTTLASSVSATGSVVVDQQATVDPTITGTVVDLAVNVGDTVKKGDFLFSIVNDDLDASVAQSSASYQQAINAVESAKVERKQSKAEYESAKNKDENDGDSYTTEELNILKRKIELAENSIVQTQKSLTASGISYRNQISDASKRKVTAAISGTVNEVNIKNGDDLNKNSSSNSTNTSPIIIGDLNTLKAQIAVNEVDISKISVDQEVTMTLDAIEGKEFKGKVEKIDSLGTENSGVVTYTVTIGFDSLDSKIMPSMSVTASIVIEGKENVLAVPTSAIKTAGGKRFVEVLNSEGIPEKKTVEIGMSNDTDTEITSGLGAGDKVIIQTVDSSLKSSSSTSGTSSSSKRTNSMMGGGMMGGGPMH